MNTNRRHDAEERQTQTRKTGGGDEQGAGCCQPADHEQRLTGVSVQGPDCCQGSDQQRDERPTAIPVPTSPRPVVPTHPGTISEQLPATAQRLVVDAERVDAVMSGRAPNTGGDHVE